MGSLGERERRAWTNRRTSSNSTVAWGHDTLDDRLVTVAIEATAFDVWTQGAKIISVLHGVVGWHVLVTHPTRCW